jgi:hypothetical protein
MTADLGTTNVFLGIMAAVSVLQAVAIIGTIVASAMIYRRVLDLVDGIERRHVAPAAARVNEILDDVKDVTSTVRKETGHIEHLVTWILDAITRRRSSAHEPPRGRVM